MKNRLPLFTLLIYRRRRLLLALTLGLISFESLIAVVATLTSPADLLAQKGANSNSFDAFAGSSGNIELASVTGLLGAGLLHPFWIALQLSAVGSLTAALLAADVEDGTIELIAVRPISRARLMAERLGAVVSASVILCIAAVLPYVAGTIFSDTIAAATSLKGAVSACISSVALVLAFIGIGTLASCRLRRRSAVFTCVGGLAAITYAMNFLAEMWQTAHGARYLTPFHYYKPADALAFARIDGTNLVILTSAFVVFSIAAFISLKRRDLTR